MDLQTLILANLALILCILVGVGCFWSADPQAPGIGAFLRCTLTLTVAGVLIAALMGGSGAPHDWLLALAYGLIVLGFAFLNQGLAQYWGSRWRGGPHLAGALATVGLYAFFSMVYPRPEVRTVIVGTALALELGIGAGLFVRQGVRPAALVTAGFAAFNLVRGPLAWWEKGHPVRERWLRLATVYGFLLFAAVLALALVWMVIVDLRARLDRLACTDDLTGLCNRRALELEAARLLAQPQPLALLAMDLDHFKQINDLHGHAAGDFALCEVADYLRGTLRGHEIAARPGGEEFVVLLPGLDTAGAAALGERLRRGIEALPLRFEARDLRLTASFGVAGRQGGEDWPSWLQRADQALYAAKQAGRNCVRSAVRKGAVVRR